jgi:4-nitrophenyl phosphatase
LTAQNNNLLANYRYALLDMDGVLYRGDEPLPGLHEFFALLRAADIKFLMLTNNASKKPEDFAVKLGKMGVEIEPHEVVTSAQTTALYLEHLCPEGAGIYVVGMPPLKELLYKSGKFYPDDYKPRYVVQGVDFGLVYDTLKKACLLIRAGAQFIATNADPVFPSEEGLIPGAGSIGALLATATGQKPLVVGKPEAPMYELALIS